MFARRESVIITSLCLGLFVCLAAGCGSGDTETPAPSASIPADGGEASTAGTNPATTPATGPAVSPIATRQVPPEDLFPEVVFKTSAGEFKVRLNREKARATVENFLRNYVDRQYYDNTIFHQVNKGFIVLGGAFTAELEAKPKRAEIHSEAYNGLKNRRGTIAMARDPAYANSASNQFFFNLVDNPALDHIGRDTSEDYGYCVFGEVVEGVEVLDKIAEVPTEDRDGFTSLPVQTVLIESVRRLR